MSISALVDELGPLSEQLAAAAKLNKRADEIKALLREHAESRKPRANQDVVLRGKRYIATVAAFPPQRVLRLTMGELCEKLGLAKFLQLCSMTVKSLEEHLEPSVCAAVLKKGHGPTRPVTVQAR